MLKKWISRYRNIFDVQIHNSTLIVLVISGLICMIGSLSTPNQSYAQSLKTSTLE